MLRNSFRPLSQRLRSLHTATRQRKDQFIQNLQKQQLRAIDPDSLVATLEAHRASNTALKIRRVGYEQTPRAPQVPRSQYNTLPKARIDSANQPESGTLGNDEDGRPLSKTPEDASLHYGEVVHVLPEHRAPQNELEELTERPWRNGRSQIYGDRRQALHTDIEMYAEWVSLSKEEAGLRRSVVVHLQKVLQHDLPDIAIYSFGSLESGMSTPCSDVDVGFYLHSLAKDEGSRGPSSFRPRAVKLINKSLASLAHLLADLPELSDVQLVLPARKPLVQATLSGPLLQLQLVSSGPEQLGALVHIRNYCADFHQLKPLYFVIKAALTIRDLSEPKRGGLGSYQLAILIGSFLKLQPRTSKESLSTTLVDFLSWVADLNTSRYGVSVDPPSVFRKHSDGTTLSLQAKEDMNADPRLVHRHKIGLVDDDMPFALTLQDPTNLSHDVARSCYRIMDIRATFRSLAGDISRWLEHDQAVDRLAHPDAIVKLLLGNVPEAEHRRRQISGAWAARHAHDLRFSPPPL